MCSTRDLVRKCSWRGWREVWNGGVRRMAGFCLSLPICFARGSLGQHYLASSRNAHGGLGTGARAPAGRSVISKASAESPPRGLGAQHSSHPVHPGNVAGATVLRAGARGTGCPSRCRAALQDHRQSSCWLCNVGPGSTARMPLLPCSHSDSLGGTHASIVKRRSLKHRDVGKLLEVTQRSVLRLDLNSHLPF